MIQELIAIHDDLTVGVAVHDAKGRISFEYSQGWLTDSRFPLTDYPEVIASRCASSNCLKIGVHSRPCG
jgi:hypothetical protein